MLLYGFMDLVVLYFTFFIKLDSNKVVVILKNREIEERK